MPLYLGTKYIGSTVMHSSVETGLTMKHIVQEAGQSESLIMSQKAVTNYVDNNLPYVTPEQFGAVGDSVTDDAEAITQALANSKCVTFDGTKTYAVGSIIVIPADAHVDFCGATIVPLGNHDVIRVKPGSFIENLVIRCTEVSGWDSSAIVLHGADKFRAINPTKICNVKLYCNTGTTAGLTTNGIGKVTVA